MSGTVTLIDSADRARGKQLAADLRKLADAAERGEIVDFTAAYVQSNEYCFLFAASQADCLTLTTLAHHTAVDNMRVKA